MVRKTLMSLLFAGSVAVVPVAWAEGSSGSSSDPYGSGSSTGSGSTSDGMGGSSTGSGSSSGMSGTGSASEIYQRECITAAQKRTQRCMDLQKSMEGSGSGSSTGPSSSGGSDSPSGMGSGSSTTSPTVP